ncbi:MAG: hypothetical protein WDW36_000572 [Sanguina aurantia]
MPPHVGLPQSLVAATSSLGTSWLWGTISQASGAGSAILKPTSAAGWCRGVSSSRSSCTPAAGPNISPPASKLASDPPPPPPPPTEGGDASSYDVGNDAHSLSWRSSASLAASAATLAAKAKPASKPTLRPIPVTTPIPPPMHIPVPDPTLPGNTSSSNSSVPASASITGAHSLSWRSMASMASAKATQAAASAPKHAPTPPPVSTPPPASPSISYATSSSSTTPSSSSSSSTSSYNFSAVYNSMPPSILQDIEDSSRRKQTGVSLKYILDFGGQALEKQKLLSAKFLHNEIPIRLAHRITELTALPPGLAMQPQVQRVKGWYAESFKDFRDFPPVKTNADAVAFTVLLKALVTRHNNVVPAIAKGVEEYKRNLREEVGHGGVLSLTDTPLCPGGASLPSSPNCPPNCPSPVPALPTALPTALPQSQLSRLPSQLPFPSPSSPNCSPNCPSPVPAPPTALPTALPQSQLPQLPSQPPFPSPSSPNCSPNCPPPVPALPTALPTALPQNYLEQRAELQTFLDTFFLSRIALRFLVGHHIAIFAEPREQHVGLIHTKCSPVQVCTDAVADARAVCYREFGEAPEVIIHGNPDLTFAYVPSHLQQMTFELVKNSLRAVQEKYSDSHNEAPPIHLVVAEGIEDITIKVSDQGGGIRRSGLPRIWTYLYTTARNPLPDVDEFTTNLPSVLAGYGCGLPLSRLYSRYFGGDISIISMEGYGTDAYLHLNRLGNDTEPLPGQV